MRKNVRLFWDLNQELLDPDAGPYPGGEHWEHVLPPLRRGGPRAEGKKKKKKKKKKKEKEKKINAFIRIRIYP